MVRFETDDGIFYGYDYGSGVFLTVPYKRMIRSGVDILEELEDLVAEGAVVKHDVNVHLELHTGED